MRVSIICQQAAEKVLKGWLGGPHRRSGAPRVERRVLRGGAKGDLWGQRWGEMAEEIRLRVRRGERLWRDRQATGDSRR
jgi:hypothetical protein